MSETGDQTKMAAASELYYSIHRGFKAGLLDSVSGLEADDTVWTVELCLTGPDSWQLSPTEDLARVFGSIVHKLVELRSIWILFAHHLGEVIQNLRGLDLQGCIGGGGLKVEVPPPHLPLLSQVLETVAFTTSYGWVEAGIVPSDGSTAPIADFTSLLKNLDQAYLLVVFELYNESMEVISRIVPPEVVINAVREVGAIEAVRVRC